MAARARYVVEVDSRDLAGADARTLAERSRAAVAGRDEVRFLRSVYVPEDERCFLLFEGECDADVREVVRRTGLHARASRVARVNRLSYETSPYLLQHADNPVDWYPWGEDALARARELDRPILLSIGYSACHWCHVMEHESFEDAGTAQVMNDLFVPVKVDREERPDLDALYMGAVVALTGHGGWPMTVFLTPGGEPFYGGTYYPPEPRGGLPSFRQVLHGVSSAWQERREAVVGQAAELTAALAAPSWRADASAPDGDEALLTDALLVLRAQLDERNGGFGGAPKFPPHAVLPFLLRMHVRTGSAEALRMAESTLAHMANGGICDQVGGGFHRYAVDAIWLVPHFEKMLYDNALLARAYTEAHVVTGEARWREVAEQTLDYLLRDLLLEHGGFASAQDADTEGEEGTTYTWTPAQLEAALDPELAEVAATLWGVTPEGNFEGATVLSRVADPAEAGADPATLANLRARLLEARATRPQPALDDKALASWNGMALAALARAGAAFGEARYVDAARRTAEFLLGPLSRADGGLWRTHRAGRSQVPGFLDDHAQVAAGLLELHRATGERRWLDEARRLARLAVERFGDEAGGFFDTASDAERLVARRKDVEDNPTPSGTSTLAGVLVQLAAIDEEERLAELARAALAPVRSALGRAPSAFGHALGVLADLTRGHRTLVLAGATPENELARVALERFDPGLPVVFGDGEGPGAPGGKLPVDGRPAAYLCQSGTCLPAVTTPAELAALLNPA